MEAFKRAIGYHSDLKNNHDGYEGSYPTRRNSFTQKKTNFNPQISAKIPLFGADETEVIDKRKNKKLELKNLAGTLLVNKQNTFDSNAPARVVVVSSTSINSQQQNNNDIFSENCGAYNDQDENSSLLSTEMGIRNEGNNHLTSSSNDNENIYEVSNTARNPVKAAFKLGKGKNVFNHFCCR